MHPTSIHESELAGGASTHSVPAVEKVLSILELLAGSVAGMTLRELSEVSELPKSSVHGILITLQRCGYLYRSPRTSRYLFSGKLLSLAKEAIGSMNLRDRSEPHLRKLGRQTNLTSYLAIIDNHEGLVIARQSPVLRIRAEAYWIGMRVELHCTGLGKALIAYWPNDRVERLASEHSLSRHNDNTIATLTKLLKELGSVRAAGFAVDDEEYALGFRSLGAPVFDAAGNVIAAVGVAGSTLEITPENLTPIGSALRAVAVELTQTQ